MDKGAAILGLTLMGCALAASSALAGHPKLPPTFPPRCTSEPTEFPDPFGPVYDPNCTDIS